MARAVHVQFLAAVTAAVSGAGTQSRRELGLSLDYLGDRCLTDVGMLQQVEAGECDPGRRVAQDLDRALNCGGGLWDAWADAHLADLLRGRPTITDLLPEVFQVRAYAPLIIPDPYLTDDYAAALGGVESPMASPHLDSDRPHIARLSAASFGSPFHCLVIDESALTRSLAGPDVTRAQVLRLHKLSQSQRITVHVIPADTGPRPGLRGAFWTLCFSPAHTLVYTPQPCGPGALISEAAHVKAYTDLFATLQGVALPAEESAHRLVSIAARVPTPERRALTTG
ncbi:helix-turn-helix transcriptional regulator [Nocardiopsis sp. NRRL B-16309]|uniref:helix-turn-helix domain-containing protein n=1 Tax=Nocardiopsis sp. NRRL B-16309 TaxID=1519494 RepID=UPI000B01BF1B|nr:helix-turn-helix transcriptional regulator [Nocardiopsis sp. NRRL B-16309]